MFTLPISCPQFSGVTGSTVSVWTKRAFRGLDLSAVKRMNKRFLVKLKRKMNSIGGHFLASRLLNLAGVMLQVSFTFVGLFADSTDRSVSIRIMSIVDESSIQTAM